MSEEIKPLTADDAGEICAYWDHKDDADTKRIAKAIAAIYTGKHIVIPAPSADFEARLLGLIRGAIEYGAEVDKDYWVHHVDFPDLHEAARARKDDFLKLMGVSNG